ncbi:hypothetical protein BD413DRAFT_251520 [Trametes elegans]|nr:hypothetical protein BD413DRAFT_251520 [Trametes elegans]
MHLRQQVLQHLCINPQDLPITSNFDNMSAGCKSLRTVIARVRRLSLTHTHISDRDLVLLSISAGRARATCAGQAQKKRTMVERANMVVRRICTQTPTKTCLSSDAPYRLSGHMEKHTRRISLSRSAGTRRYDKNVPEYDTHHVCVSISTDTPIFLATRTAPHRTL